jgi:4-hydroxy-tetrahydrodipicolinate reductase
MSKFGGYMPYINEKHHCHKLDAPSGTAKSLQAIVEDNMHANVDMSAVRCGEIPGIHTVGFEGLNDRITMTHEAFSREGFAAGAVEAAKLAENAQGVHEFKDLIFNGNN